jgi:spermidine synthase
MSRQKWHTDRAYGTVQLSYLFKRSLLKIRSKYQSIEILDTVAFGRALFLSGDMQLTQRDEYIYHEMISHVALFTHRRARRVLIVGGGDGGTLREVLKHGVEKVTLVEIDEAVVKSCKEFLPSLSGGAFNDPRVDLVIADGATYIFKSKEIFDVILVDSTDRRGPARILFSKKFYRACKERLGRDGILVNQIGMPFLFPQFHRTMVEMRSKLFAWTTTYLAVVPSYYGGAIGFGWATKSKLRCDDDFYRKLERRFRRSGIKTRYYSPRLHQSSFALPSLLPGYVAKPPPL